METRNHLKEVFLFMAMVGVEFTNVGLTTLFKAATSRGLSYHVFLVYTYAIATIALLPFLFIFPSTAVLPTFKFPLFSRICLLGLIGFLSQMLGYKGIAYSSPTLASAISNLTPAFTFALAIIFRMEKLALRSTSTLAKIIGTVVSISGALLMVLYKGPIIVSASSSTNTASLQQPLGSPETNWVIGGLLLVADYLLLSIWYIIQTQVMKMYPAELLVVFLYNLSATIISIPVCFMEERDPNAWRLKPDITLVSILYAGFTGSSLNTVVHSWAFRLKGPVFVASFKPLSIAIAYITGVIFLGDAVCLGGVIGAVIICVGFYAVTWGKAKEGGVNDDPGFNARRVSSHGKTPLFQRLKVEESVLI